MFLFSSFCYVLLSISEGYLAESSFLFTNSRFYRIYLISSFHSFSFLSSYSFLLSFFPRSYFFQFISFSILFISYFLSFISFITSPLFSSVRSYHYFSFLSLSSFHYFSFLLISSIPSFHHFSLLFFIYSFFFIVSPSFARFFRQPSIAPNLRRLLPIIRKFPSARFLYKNTSPYYQIISYFPLSLSSTLLSHPAP